MGLAGVLCFTILFISAFFLNLEIIIRTVVIQDFCVTVMHKVRIPIKFFLNVIWLFCHNRKSAVNILQWILRWLQKRMTEWITAHLAGRGKYSCIDRSVRIAWMSYVNLWRLRMFLQMLSKRSSEHSCCKKRYPTLNKRSSSKGIRATWENVTDICSFCWL